MFVQIIQMLSELLNRGITLLDYVFIELPYLIIFLIIMFYYLILTITLNVMKVDTLNNLMQRLIYIFLFVSICYTLSVVFKQPIVLSWMKPAFFYFITVAERDTSFMLCSFFQFSYFLLSLFSFMYFLMVHSISCEFISLLKKWSALPLMMRYRLFFFTISFAIPNKVIVHNQIPIIFWIFLNAFLLACTYSFPMIFIGYLSMWWLILWSFIIGILFHFEWFKVYLTNGMFNQNIQFSSEYVEYFMGNSARAAWVKGVSFGWSAAVGGQQAHRKFYREKKFADRVGKERAAIEIADKTKRGEYINTNDINDHHIDKVLKDQPMHHSIDAAKEMGSSLKSLGSSFF